jgi:hypothetical protein
MLMELRAINRNIEFMIRNQFEEKERWNSVEQFIKAGPTYSNAGVRQTDTRLTGLTSTPTHSAAVRAPVHVLPISSVPTITELRSNQRLTADVQAQYNAMEENQIGNVNSNKKSRCLLRAGGESSRHVHIDWPHDYVLSGPDKDRIYYKDLNLEQWAYGYTCILENQSNPQIKDNMIGHLKHFFHDTISYGFRRAKGAHAEVLSEMELGKFNWHDQHAITETRRTHTQRQ